MALFGRDHDKDKKSDKDGDKAQASADHDQATEELVDGMLASSGGDMGRLAQLIAQHRMQREHRVWAFLQKKLGNRKSAELQKEVDATAQAVATEAEAANDNTKGEKPDYKAFCASFATKFASVMSEFPSMTETTVSHYFTPAQVAALNDFMSTNIVPPNLFHQASGPKLTAQQRILLAGVILAKGKLPPELYGKGNERRDKFDDDGKAREGDGRLHATSCGTWAQQVSLYAGAGIAKYNQQDPQTVDSGGTLHLGNAETEKTFGSHDDNTGLQLQGKQKAAAQAQAEAEAAGRAKAEAAGEEYQVPKKHQEFSRKAEMGAAAFDALHPGDWIYIYNANSSATGQHSEIFIGWADDAVHTDKTSGVKYKTANVMSQLHVEDGGKIHQQKLGASYAPGIATVTSITRVTANSGELQDVHSLVASDAVEQNAKILEDNHLDGAELHAKLIPTANKELSTLIAKKLDPKQEALFRKAIDEAAAAYSPESLALLIACVQRLDLKTGGVFTGRPATGIIDGTILGKGAAKKKKKK